MTFVTCNHITFFFYKKCLVYAVAHRPKLHSGFLKCGTAQTSLFATYMILFGSVVHFCQKGKSGNKKEVQM